MSLLRIGGEDIGVGVFAILIVVIRVFGGVLIGVGRPCSQRRFSFHSNKVHFSKIKTR